MLFVKYYEKKALPLLLWLTARDDDESQMKGFDVLADDYITKPFSMPLVLKRIEADAKKNGYARYNQLYHSI